jgi:hypothetical protein
MKKYMLVTLVIAFLLVTVGSAFALTVANTSKKGSLLIFPLLRTDGNATLNEQYDTLITIGNDYQRGVFLECIFVLQNFEGTFCNHQLQFDFPVTPGQPISFWASSGENLDGDDIMGGGIGFGQLAEAKCWAKRFWGDDDCATSPGNDQLSFNHLTGEATLVRNINNLPASAASYNAWRFAANAPFGTQVGADPVDRVSTLLLTGTTGNYDACPASLLFDYLHQAPPNAREYDSSVDNLVALVPCKQDLTQLGGPTLVKQRVVRYDENERSSSGEICVNCFFANSLAKAPGFPGLNTPAGVFRAEPFAEPGGPCHLPNPVTDTYPVVGVILKTFGGWNGPISATTPTGSGTWVPDAATHKGTPAISWNNY